MALPSWQCPWGCEGRALCGQGLTAGVDEAGRGPLAGPVVAAAIIFPPGEEIPEVGDSKRFSPRRREELYEIILSRALSWSVAVVGPREIDELNILRASLRAMAEAVRGLDPPPSALVIDGPHTVEGLEIPQRALVKGDGFCPLIGAASIVAKVTRDRIMSHYHRLYPQYGFAQHKGYPTQSHREALKKYGPSPIHRRSFRLLPEADGERG